MSAVAMKNLETSPFTIICDDRCVIVRRLATIVKWWDRARHFRFVDRDSTDLNDRYLIEELDAQPWSLLLIDEEAQRWSGPESIPIILKNLPFGKIAAVAYILPGTMFITRQLYLLVSRINRMRPLPQRRMV